MTTLDITATDLFCGAGGSSIGAVRAGVRLQMAANHWRLAIESHASNFPDSDHDCADVSQVEPRRYPSTTLLIASPECTHQSMARTSTKHQPNLFDPDGDATAERSRATMWDVPRFAEFHRYEAVVVENVVEAIRWAPFDSWLQAMDSLGYEHRILSLNSMTAWPTPQSRDRIYVVFWRAGNRVPDLDFPVLSWCPACDELVEARQVFKRQDRIAGKYRQQYLYRCPSCREPAWPLVTPAAEAIDWDIVCPRIGDRDRPLAPATRRRIQIGLERFGASLIQNSGNTYERPASGYVRAWPVTQPRPTQMTTDHHALVVPVHGGHKGSPARGDQDPLPTQTTHQENGLVMPLRTHGSARPADANPLATITTGGGGGMTVVVPFIAELRNNSTARSVADPLSTITAGGGHHGLTVPPAFVVKNYGDGEDPSMAKDPLDPLGAITSIDHHSLVMTYRRNGQLEPVTVPLTTQTTKETHALVDVPSIEVDDCGFRMLSPAEIGRGMAFPTDYVVLGNNRDRVKQYGNAVTPPVMDQILERVIASLS